MAENRVGIVIEGRNKSAAAFNEVKGQLAGLDGAAKTAMGGFGGLAGMVAGGFAVSQIIGITKELVAIGAQAERTEASFHRVAQSYGADADKMLAAMKRASSGQISNDELMMAANKAMMLGVTADADQMAGLLQAAMERGQAMGRTAADAFNDIVIGIGRMSPLILDNLGIMTGGEAAFAAYAATIGKTAEQLTDFERRQMLINKVLADAGPVTLDSQAKIELLAASWANFREAAGKRVTLALEVDTTGISEGLDNAALMMNATTELDLALRKIDTTQLERLDWTQLGTMAPITHAPMMDFLQEMQEAKNLADDELKKTGDATSYAEAIDAIQQSIVEFSQSLSIATGDMGALRLAEQLAADAALAGASAMQQLVSAAAALYAPLTQAEAALSAWDLAVGALVPNLDAVSESTQQAIERIKSIGIGAVDVLGASGAIDQIHAYEDAMQGLRNKAIALKWDDLTLATAQQELFNQFGDQISGLRRVTNATSTYNAELSALLSTTEQFINASVGSTKGLVDLGDQGLVNGFDPNGPARDFGRMWDVAINGFQSQWLDELRAQGLIPDDVIAAGEDALRQFAEGKARAFQSGADLGLLDTGQIVEQVKAELAARAELERVKREVLAQLRGAGIGGAGAAAAVDTVMGIEPAAGTSKAEAGGVAGKSFQDGFVTGMVGLGTKVTTELARQMVVQAVALAAAGKDAGDKFAGGFTERAGDLPSWFLDFLAGQLTPLVEARIKANATRSQPPTGAQP